MHGLVELPPFLWHFIDTDTFQRLRYLRQTGLLHYVYPCATHTRFTHSLGTAKLARDLIQGLATRQPELGITRGEVATTVLAALLHDLGHGPASHAFQGFMHRVTPSWRHEQQSVRLFQHMIVCDGPLLQHVIDEEGVDVHMVAEMICGKAEEAPAGWCWHGPPAGREFLFDIVSAPSGLDVDKLDYLQRDATSLGMHTGASCVDVPRLLAHCRVVDIKADGHVTRRLAWPPSESYAVMHVFLARFDMHFRCYQHRVGRVVELMVMEGLYTIRNHVLFYTADGVGVTLANAHTYPSAYVKLTDWVIDAAIQNVWPTLPASCSGGASGGGGVDAEPDPDKAAAAALFSRVRARGLWPTIGQLDIPASVAFDAEELAGYLLAHAPEGTTRDDFVVDVSCADCGHGDGNPVAGVTWIGDIRPVEYPAPVFFQLRLVRVFVKRDDLHANFQTSLREWAAPQRLHVTRTPA